MTSVRLYVSDAELNRAVVDGETLSYQMTCLCKQRFGDTFVKHGEVTFDKAMKSWTALVELQ